MTYTEHSISWTPEAVACILADSGYRLTSNRFGIVSRVDRPGACKHGFDFYRRVHSTDKIEGLPECVCRHLRVGGPAGDVGYRPLHPHIKLAVAACAGWRDAERKKWLQYHKERRTLKARP
jgi:hypothetical protein